MTYLELVNNVLARLREETIEGAQINSNPYYRIIGTHVNDAKRQVENAWEWGALRDTDYIPLPTNTMATYELPESADRSYVIKRIASYPNTSTVDFDAGTDRMYLRWNNIPQMKQKYQHPDAVPQGRATDFAVVGEATNGNKLIQVFPRPLGTNPNVEHWLEIEHTKNQPELTDPNDVLLVPSLPVYTLATALASRERGEVGGTPTSELFAVADRYLSDAIAYDSALYANELDWSGNIDYPNRTNFRFA